MLPEFDLFMPDTLAGALEAVAADDAVALAGGTNLLVDMRGRRAGPKTLVNLGGLSALQTITRGDGHLTIGAGVTVADLLLDPIIAEDAPVLRDAAMVRNVATVAGNICFGSPAADLAPSLLALDAVVVLESAGGSRVVALADFFEGLRRTACRSDEIVTALRCPVLPTGSVSRFHKLGLRKGDAITVVGMAVSLSVANGVCSRARIALGAVAPVVLRATTAEAMLEGETLTPELIDEAARQAVDACSPIDDIRATADYRRHIVNVVTRRLVAQASGAIH